MIFMLKKPYLKVQILQHKFLDWKRPPLPHLQLVLLQSGLEAEDRLVRQLDGRRVEFVLTPAQILVLVDQNVEKT